MKPGTDVAIIGAGPYGLSLAAHLRARGVKYRIFGDAMRFWVNMPIGVNLKSLAFATNIALPKSGHSFPEWCRQHGLEDFEPCTMQSFATYGLEIQKQFIPDLENVLVTNVSSRPRTRISTAAGANSAVISSTASDRASCRTSRTAASIGAVSLSASSAASGPPAAAANSSCARRDSTY